VRKRRLDSYPAAVLATALRRRQFGPEDRLLAALSGGPDSTALVAALAAIRDAGGIAELRALHVDHGLRPGVAEEAARAAAACARLGVPFRSVRVRVAPGNLQAQARRARYAALRAEADRVGATRIATGHTRTDQAETVLLRLLRGAGARGLSGIPPRRGRIVRPLVDRSRAEGLAWLSALGLPWSEDPTNRSPRHARNRLRLEAWPVLEALSPALERSLSRMADLSREDERALARRAREVAPGTAVAASALRGEPAAVRRRVVRRLHAAAAGRGATLAAAHVAAVLALCRRDRPGRLSLPGAVEARWRYGRLEMGPPAGASPAVEPVEVGGPGRYAVPALGLAVEVRGEPGEAFGWPLVLRTRRPGDRFRPEGGRGSKKLKSWLIDRKVPRERRDALLVLADRKGRVLLLPSLGARAAGLEAGFSARILSVPGGLDAA
jgi:tRNA(Ile)-lysidine synthase